MPHPVAHSGRDLYEADFYAWTQDQAAKLRRLEEQAVNLDLDLPRLAEEVEDLGKAERDAVRSQVTRIIERCLKLEYSPVTEPRLGWYDSIDDARTEVADKLATSLREDLRRSVPVLYERARRKAERTLRRYGEGIAADALPETCPYALADLLRDGWYPKSRHGHEP